MWSHREAFIFTTKDDALRVAENAKYDKNFLAPSAFFIELAFTLIYISPLLEKQRGVSLACLWKLIEVFFPYTKLDNLKINTLCRQQCLKVAETGWRAGGIRVCQAE